MLDFGCSLVANCQQRGNTKRPSPSLLPVQQRLFVGTPKRDGRLPRRDGLEAEGGGDGVQGGKFEGHGLRRATSVQRTLPAKGGGASVVSRVQGQLLELAVLFHQVGQSD